MSEQLDRESVNKIFSEYPVIVEATDVEIWGQRVRLEWDKFSEGTRRNLTRRLRERIAQKTGTGVVGSGDDFDYATVSVLPELFAKYGLVALSLRDWRKQKDELLKADMPLTLILVDEDFSKEGASSVEGITLIKELFKATKPEKVLCALLSHKYGVEGIHDSWKTLCKRENLDPSRFVLIPKALFIEDLIGFGRLVKLAVLNESVGKLKTIATEILLRGVEEAGKKLNEIDIYDFDQIVFLSSYREGVWEPDTLFRIFGLFHRDETRKVAKANAGLYDLADKIRHLSQIPTKSKSAPNYNTMQLQRLELYEDPDFLNSHFMPIDLGDIFQKTGHANKRFVLLAQPCDLMVRSSGKRSHQEAALVEIVSGESYGNRPGYAELRFLDSESSAKHYVALARSFAVTLTVLDFCAFQSNGEAVFRLGTSSPHTLIPAWKAHFERVAAEVAGIIAKVNELTKSGVKLQDAELIVARCSNQRTFKPTVDPEKKTIRFNLRRVGRLRQPEAASLLSRYAAFSARYAFDHDFGEREIDSPDEAKPATNGTKFTPDEGKTKSALPSSSDASTGATEPGPKNQIS